MPGPMNGTPVSPAIQAAENMRTGTQPKGALSAYAAPDAGTQFVNTLRFAAQQQQQPSDYASMFQNALAQARSGINSQLGAALGDIQNNQQLAGQALATLPGQVNADYGQAFGTMGNAEKAIEAAQAKSGVGSLTPLQSYMQPVDAAVHGSQAAALANVPLLNIGIQQAAAQQRAAAEMGAQGDNNQLQQQSMQFAMQQAAAQQAAQQQQASALQNYQYQQQLQDDPNRNFGPSAGAGNTQLVDPKTGLPTGVTANQLTATQKTPQYQRAAAQLQNADTKDVPMIWHQLNAVYAKQPAVLQALADFFFKGSPPPNVNTPVNNSPDTPGWAGAYNSFQNSLSRLPGGRHF